jgi:predicted nucleic acid-binding protein
VPAAKQRGRLRLLIDTNVILDVVLGREPWAAEGALVLNTVRRGGAQGFVAAHSITTLHYIVERQRDRTTASTAVSDLLSVLQVHPVSTTDFHRALALGLSDFEDAVQAAVALAVDAHFVVTRNERDFKGAPVECRTPGEILALLLAGSEMEGSE